MLLAQTTEDRLDAGPPCKPPPLAGILPPGHGEGEVTHRPVASVRDHHVEEVQPVSLGFRSMTLLRCAPRQHQSNTTAVIGRLAHLPGGWGREARVGDQCIRSGASFHLCDLRIFPGRCDRLPAWRT